jgi:hypothetical protein
MFIWAEWPDIHGAAAYVAYFGKLLRYVSTSRIPINQIVLRITNPQLGAVDNLFNVSTDSIVYKELLSKLPASVDLMMYPYLLASADQAVWKGISGTTALEGVFKYTSQWNRLLGETRFKGVVVDGEEKVGFASDMASAPAYKTKYGVPIFGYTTGYPQVGDLTKYAPSVDLFYLEMYDFYVENSPTLKLVQNTDTATPQDFAAKLDSQVWLHAINSYDDPRIMFMWSLQNSASSACIYPLNGSCGSKEDFGTQSIDYFMSFIAEVKTRYPPKFGNKPHGMFQFNFMPTSWFST